MAKRIVAVNEKGNRIGEDHQRAKLTDRDVELIRQLLADGWAPVEIARKFEVSRQTICDIHKGRRRSQIAMGWRTLGLGPYA